MSTITLGGEGKVHMHSLLQRSWWVFLFLGILSLFYLHGMHKKQQAYVELKGRLKELEKERAIALANQEDLLLQIRSQSDPAWVEMTLVKNLGVVPDGQVKVYFQRE